MKTLRLFIFLLAAVLFAGIATAQNVPNYTTQGGALTVIGDAGALRVDGTLLMGVSSFNICGDNTTINDNIVYYGPSIALTANTSGGQACDINAAGNTTEGTADAPIYTSQAFQVLGMTCRNEADAGADISYTLRSAAAATVPSVTCTIADDDRDCVADVQSTTDIAAGATVAVAAAAGSAVGDNTGFICQVFVAY
jgi:hypothetical protein